MRSVLQKRLRRLAAPFRFFALYALCALCVLSALCALCALLCGCAPEENNKGRTVAQDVSVLEEALRAGGRQVVSYGSDSAMIDALYEEMQANYDLPPDYPPSAYLFAKDGVTGELDCEVFLLKTEDDARRLYDYLKENGSFTEGESDLRIFGRVVYMGFLQALGILEATGA